MIHIRMYDIMSNKNLLGFKDIKDIKNFVRKKIVFLYTIKNLHNTRKRIY